MSSSAVLWCRAIAAKSEELEFDKTMNGSWCRSNLITLSLCHTGPPLLTLTWGNPGTLSDAWSSNIRAEVFFFICLYVPKLRRRHSRHPYLLFCNNWRGKQEIRDWLLLRVPVTLLPLPCHDVSHRRLVTMARVSVTRHGPILVTMLGISRQSQAGPGPCH